MTTDERKRYQARIIQLITERDDALAVAAAESEASARMEAELRRLRAQERVQLERSEPA